MKREPFIPVTNNKKKGLLGFQLMLLGLNMEKIGQTPLWLLQNREPGPPGPPALLRGGFPFAHVCLLFQGDPCPAWQEVAVRGSVVKWAFPCALALTRSSWGSVGLLQVPSPGWGVWVVQTPCPTPAQRHEHCRRRVRSAPVCPRCAAVTSAKSSPLE